MYSMVITQNKTRTKKNYMKTSYDYKKLLKILSVFIGLAIGIQIGVGFSKSVGQFLSLVKWQKEVLLGCVALFLLVLSFRKTIHLLVGRNREITFSDIARLLLKSTILGMAFYLLLSAVVFLLLHFLVVNM